MHAARARSDVSSTSRRSKRSAITPAGIDSRMYGSRRAAPTMPRTIAFCVSWYTSDDQGDQVQPVPDRRHELTDEQAGQRPVAQQLAVCTRSHPAPRAVGAPVSSAEATLPVARAWTRHRHAPPE